jgi:hypothetical protein
MDTITKMAVNSALMAFEHNLDKTTKTLSVKHYQAVASHENKNLHKTTVHTQRLTRNGTLRMASYESSEQLYTLQRSQ